MTDKFDMEALDALMRRPSVSAENRVHEWQGRLERAFKQANPQGGAAAVSPELALLRPCLAAVGWAGLERHVQEALPHFEDIADIEALRGALARLGIESKPAPVAQTDMPSAYFPCLFRNADGRLSLLIGREEDGRIATFDGETQSPAVVEPDTRRGTAYLLRTIDILEQKRANAKVGWVGTALGHFRPLIVKVVAVSFLINLAALALPFFIMHTYDLGIATKSSQVVVMLAIGAGIVIATELALRRVRSAAMAYFGARFDALLSMSAFQHLLHLPIQMTENAPIGSQITRLKQFETMRDVFAGTLAVAIVDIPYIIIFLAAIAVVGGHLVWIAVALIAVYAVLAAVFVPVTRRQVSRSGDARQRCQNLLMEMLSKRTAIRDVGAEDVFLARYEAAARTFTRANYRAQQTNATVQALAQLFMTIAGVATLGLGALWAMNGSLSQGALIAVMALVWRVLSPLQQAFLSLPRLDQAFQTIQQVNKLMAIKPEREPGVLPSFSRSHRGGVTVARVMFRYPVRSDLTLRGASLSIKPGEMVAITGSSGSGKSTLLKIIAGLYPPQAGAVLSDAVDLRQIDPAEWRASIGYVPETPVFFYGTIAQNMRLGYPGATDEDIAEAARDAGLHDYADILTDGVHTRLTAAVLTQVPEAFKQRLMLARAYARKAPLYLLDNPANNLDETGDEALRRKLQALKGTATVIFTTQRPSHMKLADRLVVIEDGQIMIDGPPAAVLAKLAEAA